MCFLYKVLKNFLHTEIVCDIIIRIMTQLIGICRRRYTLIIALEEAKYKLVGMRADIEELGSALKIDELKAIAEELDAKTLDPDFWTLEDSSKILQKIKQTKDVIEGYEELSARLPGTE